ncbi:hypothetical protein CC1G_13858 [Coprinopsis cinerea okayama7|uniref:Uncharacterized protein n=1 Tax=Coprinopsis cinerea (strain Okayama-7 / 130 / ATCC MYA-4618 / FGSC 9003) TaxID=240176 RepID=D6RKW0_COPC7|nr:hypothetical protein CC1G_13858 [Coprinopsis cinerea okayama7\|eukprot:XP_002911823.1 hypothetical protein CC1G_13858 [Coprinopsis cinerea okayama7\
MSRPVYPAYPFWDVLLYSYWGITGVRIIACKRLQQKKEGETDDRRKPKTKPRRRTRKKTTPNGTADSQRSSKRNALEGSVAQDPPTGIRPQVDYASSSSLSSSLFLEINTSSHSSPPCPCPWLLELLKAAAEACLRSSELSINIPGFISLLSSVAIADPSNHESGSGRHKTAKKFLRQLPCENGFGGGGPGTRLLCAWFRIWLVEVVSHAHGEAVMRNKDSEEDRPMAGKGCLKPSPQTTGKAFSPKKQLAGPGLLIKIAQGTARMGKRKGSR